MKNLFNGRYKTLDLIGKGGMSKVYLAESTTLGTKWAIKSVDKKLNVQFDLLAEPNILKKLNHPALPRIIDIEEDETNIYIIEDYIDGKSLDMRLKTEKRFDEETVINWSKQLCDVLIYLHNQKPNPIIYRDMKPANIIVTKENRVKLIDFGIAREFKIDNDSDTTYMGTRGYAAPEQYGSSQTDQRTDIYSIGVTMYHLITGKSRNEPPYEFKKIREIDPNFSEGMEYIINKCIQNDPTKRYQSMEELLYDLENIHTFNRYYIEQKKKDKTKRILKFSMIGASIVLIWFGSYTMGIESKEKYEALINKADTYASNLQFDEARKYYQDAQKVEKGEVKGYLQEAKLILKQSGTNECLQYLFNKEQEVKGISKAAEYYYIKGSVYFDNKEYDKARKNFSEALEIDNTNIDYARDCAVSNAKVGKITEAQNIIDILLNKDENEDSVNYINGEIELYEENLYEAINSFEKVIDITNNEELKRKAYISLSDIYKDNRGIIENAASKQIEILNNAEADLNNKNNVYITEALAEAYFANKQYNNSAENFNKLLDLGYHRSYIYRNLAIIYQHMNNFSRAEDILFTMMDKSPEDYSCYLQLGLLNLDREGQKPQSSRNYDKVLEYYELAVQYAPQGPQTSDVIPLGNSINELRNYGYIRR